MPYYAIAFLIYSLATVKILKKETPATTCLFILGLCPLFLIAICRGDVGTDTGAYLQIISNIQENESSGVEIGFVFLVKLLLFLELPPRFILASITAISTGLVVYAASFSKRSLLLITLCIVPIFYMDMTMNGLRYGLAFSCAMCAVGLFYRHKLHLCIIFAILSISFHLSGWLIFALMTFLSDDKKEFKKWFSITTSLGLLLLIINTNILAANTSTLEIPRVNIQGKIIAYSHIKSPSLLSGLIPLTISLISLALIKHVDCAHHAVSIRRFYILLMGIISSFLIAKFSYAGLRLQLVLLFSTLVCLQFKPAFLPLEKVRLNKKNLLFLITIGALGVAAFMKNIWASAGIGPSPWLPYSISPEIMEALDMLTRTEISTS